VDRPFHHNDGPAFEPRRSAFVAAFHFVCGERRLPAIASLQSAREWEPTGIEEKFSREQCISKTAPLFAEENEPAPLKLHLCERLPNLQLITRKQFAAARSIQLTFKERCNEGHARYCPIRFVRLVRPTRALRTRRPSSR